MRHSEGLGSSASTGGDVSVYASRPAAVNASVETTVMRLLDRSRFDILVRPEKPSGRR